jgi:hypothetical protein
MAVVAGEKFELKLLKIADVSLHEECEDNRTHKLVERFNHEFILNNPLIVGQYYEKYILVDGANRFEALKNVGCKLILAQLVNYKSPKVQLKSWYHYVNGIVQPELLGYLKINNITCNKGSFDDLTKNPPIHHNHVYAVSKKGEVLLINMSEDFNQMLSQLRDLNKFYESKYSYVRIDSDTSLEDLDSLSPEDGLLFIYPTFTKEHIVKISEINEKLPAGITRHLIPNRVLHLKYNIDLLRLEDNLDKMNEELKKFVDYKIRIKKVRLYREPVLVFDE